MARPSKYTSGLVKRITQYISDGLNIRDACYGAGISADTFCRWRKEKPEFNEAINKATEAQAWSSAALAQTSHYRRYTRRQRQARKVLQTEAKAIDTHLEQNNTLLGLLRTPQGYIVNEQGAKYHLGIRLPERSEPPVNEFGELVSSRPYFNTTTNRVEWVEKEMCGRCVLHSCRPS